MATTIKQVEGHSFRPDAIMQRIEAYIAHRFSSRDVEWIVEGPGEWCPPLIPATISTVEIWNGLAWESVTAPDSPLGGYWLSGSGPYRFAGTVGERVGRVPAAVHEAYDRLSAYMDGMSESTPSALSVSLTIPEVESKTIERDAKWIARAMQNSGAADLLRPYRRA